MGGILAASAVIGSPGAVNRPGQPLVLYRFGSRMNIYRWDWAVCPGYLPVSFAVLFGPLPHCIPLNI